MEGSRPSSETPACPGPRRRSGASTPSRPCQPDDAGDDVDGGDDAGDDGDGDDAGDDGDGDDAGDGGDDDDATSPRAILACASTKPRPSP
jgi:hypothetical protein